MAFPKQVTLACIAAGLLAATAHTAHAAPPPTPGSTLTDAQVVDSMKKAINYLLDHKSAPDNWETGHNAHSDGGKTALVLYALLHAGQALEDDDINVKLKPRSAELAPVVKYLSDFNAIATYPVGLQATALALCPHTPESTKAMIRDRDYLLDAMGYGGGYDYQAVKDGGIRELYPAAVKRMEQIKSDALQARARGDGAAVNRLNDEYKKLLPDLTRMEADMEKLPALGNNSCTQYGALGAWSLADDGMELPLSYWKTTDKYWRAAQQADGSWNYFADGHGDGQENQVQSMTVAGLATLYVAAEFTDLELRTEPKDDPAMTKGMARVVADFDPTIRNYYYLYGVERVGLASGAKFLGTTDWYREGAATIIASQQGDGSYSGRFTGGDGPVVTAYGLLFLARGRSPVAFNKLQYNGPWNARPRDDANITRWMSKQFERPINWQTVNLNVDAEQWTDSPVLLITGSKDPKFTDADIAKLRAFVNAGGIIFSSADASASAFTEACMKYASKMVDRRYEFRALPADHVLYGTTLWTKITNPPRMLGLSNGIRELWIHSTVDLGASWQMHRVASKEHYQVPANIYFYAAGKGMLHSRLRSLIVPDATDKPVRTIAVGLLDYPGNWNPEPGAWPRFAKIAASTFHTALDVAPVKPAALDAAKTPLVHMTGAASFTMPGDDAAKLTAYLNAGGTLFVDAGGGNAKFTTAFTDMAKTLVPGAALEPIPVDDPLFAGTLPDAVDARAASLRPYALTTQGSLAAPLFQGIKKNGRWVVIFSPLDVTSGMLSTNTGGITGYAPDYSQSLARNVVLYAGQPKAAAGAATAPATAP